MEEGVVLAEERAYIAYNLRIKGRDWPEIARECGYGNAREAQRHVNYLVSKARETINDEYRSEIAALEMDRLDRLQNAIWDLAIGGSLKDMDMVLKIMTMRARYTRLWEEQHETTRTVIVTSDRFVESLKEVAE